MRLRINGGSGPNASRGPGVFFFVTRYYYTNEYLKISGYPPIEFFNPGRKAHRKRLNHVKDRKSVV